VLKRKLFSPVIVVCSGQMDKMEEQEMFHMGELVFVGDRRERFSELWM